MKFLNCQKGFSLVEVMIGAGILGGLALGVAQLQNTAQKGIKHSRQSTEIDMFTNELSQRLLFGGSCAETFVNQTFKNKKISANEIINNGNKIYGLYRDSKSKKKNNSGLKEGVIDNGVYIKSMTLEGDELDLSTAGKGMAYLSVEISKQDRVIENKIPLIISYDDKKMITDCMTLSDAELQSDTEELCNKIGGKLKDEKCVLQTSEDLFENFCISLGGKYNNGECRGITPQVGGKADCKNSSSNGLVRYNYKADRLQYCKNNQWISLANTDDVEKQDDAVNETLENYYNSLTEEIEKLKKVVDTSGDYKDCSNKSHGKIWTEKNRDKCDKGYTRDTLYCFDGKVSVISSDLANCTDLPDDCKYNGKKYSSGVRVWEGDSKRKDCSHTKVSTYNYKITCYEIKYKLCFDGKIYDRVEVRTLQGRDDD